METRTCRECGAPLVDYVRGRPPTLCGECKRGRRRIKEREPVTCRDCGIVFLPPGQTGLPPERCEGCRAERKRSLARAKSQRWRDEHPELQRESSRRSHQRRKQQPGWRAYKNEAEMRRKYGLTMADFEALLAEQGGACAICGGPPNGPGVRFQVDHCHDSDRIRGLLCSKCNTAVGLLDDNPERAEKVAAYLRRC